MGAETNGPAYFNMNGNQKLDTLGNVLGSALLTLERAMQQVVEHGDQDVLQAMIKCLSNCLGQAVYCIEHGKQYVTHQQPDPSWFWNSEPGEKDNM